MGYATRHVANDFATSPSKGAMVTIRPSHGRIHSEGCGSWIPTSWTRCAYRSGKANSGPPWGTTNGAKPGSTCAMVRSEKTSSRL